MASGKAPGFGDGCMPDAMMLDTPTIKTPNSIQQGLLTAWQAMCRQMAAKSGEGATARTLYRR